MGEVTNIRALRGTKASRFLVVEDEMVIALDMERFLEDRGEFIVELASSAETARRAILRGNCQFDGAILDINLDGETSSGIARLLEEKEIPHLVISAYSQDAARQFGFDRVDLKKPFSEDELNRALEEKFGLTANETVRDEVE